MFIRSWVNILFLLAFFYGSYMVMMGKTLAANTWQYYFYLLCPWALLCGSIKAWHRCFTWRRMTAAKNKAPELSRGLHKPLKSRQRPGILEHACSGLFLISVAAILKQLGIADAPWRVVSFFISFFMLHYLIEKVR